MQNKSKQTSQIEVFDRRLLRDRRDRFASFNQDYDFLHKWASDQIAGRLNDITHEFPVSLLVGNRAPKDHRDKILNAGGIKTPIFMDLSEKQLRQTHDGHSSLIQADEEFLPIQVGSLDSVISFLNMHSINDLPGALIQINRSLKPDGVFIGSLFGGETLYELRETLTQTEMKLKGGISPRVFPFADKQQMGALMQRTGFALPVIDSELITITYDSIIHLMKDLRYMAEGNIVRERNTQPLSKRFIQDADDYYRTHFSEDDGKIFATFEIIFVIGWAPHESQQQPLRPGSAQKSLADALGSIEVKTGVKTTPDE